MCCIWVLINVLMNCFAARSPNSPQSDDQVGELGNREFLMHGRQPVFSTWVLIEAHVFHHCLIRQSSYASSHATVNVNQRMSPAIHGPAQNTHIRCDHMSMMQYITYWLLGWSFAPVVKQTLGASRELLSARSQPSSHSPNQCQTHKLDAQSSPFLFFFSVLLVTWVGDV